MTIAIRKAEGCDRPAIWNLLGPVLEAGETYSLPRSWCREEALSYWLGDDHEVFVAERSGKLVGTYYLRANQKGGGDHVANCGYVTATEAEGTGVATAMHRHSVVRARERGFAAMQFNFVVSTNERAVRLWTMEGFSVVGRLPQAFRHPMYGFVDALVMFRSLEG